MSSDAAEPAGAAPVPPPRVSDRLCAQPGAPLARVLAALEHAEKTAAARRIVDYIAARLRRGFGPLRVRAELLAQGVSPAQFEPYLARSDDDWLALLQAAHDRRFGATPAAAPRERARRARFLEYRGFPPHLIARMFAGMD